MLDDAEVSITLFSKAFLVGHPGISECHSRPTYERGHPLVCITGSLPERQDEFRASLTSDTRRLCVEVDGMGGWTSKREGEPQEILCDWLAGDSAAFRSEEPTQMANRCFQCKEWYCADHLRHERIVYGAPAYDYYFASVCTRGHEPTVERT
jgi:hypothetical protein